MSTLTLFRAGFCTAPEHLIQRGGRKAEVPLPATFALIEHPRVGYLLFDTGYSRRFYEETARGLNSLYARITPVTVREEDEARSQLRARGIAPDDIGHILISHFHADHVGALRDFPAARFWYDAAAWADVRGKQGIGALRRAFLPGLLPADFEARGSAFRDTAADALPPELAPFERGVDLFGDESVWAIPLPGHAKGQLGLAVYSDAGLYLLVADACWQSAAYRDLKLPAPLAYLLFAHPRLYDHTVKQIHQFWRRKPQAHIIPAHCAEAWEQYGTSSPELSSWNN